MSKVGGRGAFGGRGRDISVLEQEDGEEEGCLLTFTHKEGGALAALLALWLLALALWLLGARALG